MEVSAERFGQILEWFGPMISENGKKVTFLDRVNYLSFISAGCVITRTYTSCACRLNPC